MSLNSLIKKYMLFGISKDVFLKLDCEVIVEF